MTIDQILTWVSLEMTKTVTMHMLFRGGPIFRTGFSMRLSISFMQEINTVNNLCVFMVLVIFNDTPVNFDCVSGKRCKNIAYRANRGNADYS